MRLLLHRDDALFLITGNELVVCEERKVFHLGLRQEQTVKRRGRLWTDAWSWIGARRQT